MSNLSKSQKRIKKANFYLLYSVLTELMLDLNEETKGTNFYESSVGMKLKNLHADFQRNSSKIHKILGTEESELLNFYKITEIIDKVFRTLMNSSHDMELLSNTIGMLEAWQKGELTFINSEEELLEVQNSVKNDH